MRSILFFGLFLLVCCVGCGGKQGFSVGGKVTFPDGQPVTRGQVTFTSGSFTGGGSIIADGTYNINVRVPAGTYKVSVAAYAETTADQSVDIADAKPPQSLIDPKFNNPETSELVCEVKGATVFNIPVTAPAK